MKKSELRHIIRESIKELLAEQQHSLTTSVPCCQIQASSCDTNPITGNPNMLIHHGFYQLPGGTCPAVGDVIQVQGTLIGQPAPINNGAPMNFTVTVSNVTPPVLHWGNSYYYCQQAAGNPSNPTIYGLTMTPVSNCGASPIINGCTDNSAFNYDPNATQDDGSCDYGFYCKPLGDHPKFGSKCTPANQSNPGSFATLQDCLNSGCEPKSPDKGKTIKEPAGPSITPFTTDPQSKMIDPEIDRMQDLINVNK